MAAPVYGTANLNFRNVNLIRKGARKPGTGPGFGKVHLQMASK